jgi:tetratricopeptide (TPR) repeat protein
VTAALVIGLGVSTWMFFREREARRRAVAAEQQQAGLRQEAERARANEAELRRQAEVREKITQAALLVSQDRLNEADNLLDGISLAQPTVEGAAVFRAVGEWHALENRWKKAADRFGALLRINQLDGWDVCTLDYLECGPSLIELGDIDGYERFRQAAISRFAGTQFPVADRIVKICLLLPADKKVMDSLNPLTQVTEKSFTDADAAGDIFRASWRAVSLALLEYRRGDYAGAVDWSRRCLAYPENNAPRSATARIILAMSLQHLQQTDEARSELAKGRDAVETKFENALDRGIAEQGFWFDWVFARILLREAGG